MTCNCHNEQMGWQKDPRYTAGGYWFCRIKHAARMRRRYDELTGVEYNALLLYHRRWKALARKAGRHQPQEA